MYLKYSGTLSITLTRVATIVIVLFLGALTGPQICLETKYQERAVPDTDVNVKAILVCLL